MKLSERLASLNQACGMMYDDYETMVEAIELAKRYEDAPVAKAAYYYRPTMGAATGIMLEGPDFTPLAGQRVRIVLDKEGL